MSVQVVDDFHRGEERVFAFTREGDTPSFLGADIVFKASSNGLEKFCKTVGSGVVVIDEDTVHVTITRADTEKLPAPMTLRAWLWVDGRVAARLRWPVLQAFGAGGC